MLGFIEGSIVSKNLETSQVVVRCGGVGYEVTVSKQSFESLYPNTPISFWLHTHVREDIFTLFGFLSEAEKHLFRILIGVSGLGPKTALSLLSEHGPEKLIQLILNKRIAEISEAAGVGKKLAERLCLELSGKLEKLAWIQLLPKMEQTKSPSPPTKEKQLREDLSSALTHLGYHPTQIKNTLDKMLEADSAADFGFETLLRNALTEMSGRTMGSLNAEGANV